MSDPTRGAGATPPARQSDAEREAAARASAEHADAGVDEASDESFPASDPPASTHTHAGPPGEGA